MIRLPVRFGDQNKFKSLEVDFLVVDVPTIYNIIIGRPTLHRVKAVVAPYLLQLQFETNDGNIGELRGDQRTAQECYLESIKPLIEWTRERGTTGPPQAEKRAKAGPAILVPEALVIHTLASSKPLRPRPEVADAVESLLLKEGRSERTGDGNYTSGSLPSSCSSSSDALASASKGLVASSSAASPSDEGGVNSTSSGSRPSAAARSHSSTKCRSACSLLQQLWYRETSLSNRRHSTTAFHSRAKTSAMAISCSNTFGGSEAPGAAKSQDLTMSWTRESLTPGSALMKLAEGRGVSEEAPLTTGVVAPTALEGVWCPCLAGIRSPDDQLPDW
ncbi:hypothetical protein Cgig2_028491 [Carnegiea gigantea]|uniref:Uncharacterized protein n=1 Tax=Carnegiea gigantea TaxID=171969 RepID=A0A9Q1JGC2_9CARY|nr:hypothetical protein Cgig2_028491 [Carnegiea gigantea]